MRPRVPAPMRSSSETWLGRLRAMRVAMRRTKSRYFVGSIVGRVLAAGSFVSIGAGPEPPCGAAAGAAEEAGLRAALPPRGVGTPEAALRRGGRERLAVAVIGPPDEADDARTGASLLVVRLGLHSRAGAR